jgi:MoaA/NifB/PqqE/SkfB family radical SAM enzyme
VDNNGVKVINLPTNGLLPDRLEQGVDRLLAECPALEIHLNLSLDGIGETHDHQRGVPGGFHKTLSTLRRVKQRYSGRSKLITNVATVITPDNYDEVMDLSAYLLRNELCAVHLLEVVRGDPKDPATKGLSRAQVQDLQDRFYVMNEEMSRRLFDDFNPVSKAIAERAYLGFIRFLNGIQQDNLEGPSPWGMDCTAGETTLVVDHDGNFRSCEMRPPIGNLRDYGFDTTAVMESRAMRDEIAAIGGGARANCWCTHGCWIISSMKFSPRAMLLRLPAAYLKARHLSQPDFVLPRVDPARFEPRPRPAAAEGGRPA